MRYTIISILFAYNALAAPTTRVRYVDLGYELHGATVLLSLDSFESVISTTSQIYYLEWSEIWLLKEYTVTEKSLSVFDQIRPNSENNRMTSNNTRTMLQQSTSFQIVRVIC